jgi:F0F1-type ATP synthase assembly protein I
MSEELKSNNTRLGLGILQGALLIGIAGDFLLRTTPWGLNAFLWVLLVSIALIVLTYSQRREFWNKETMMLHGALLFFAATFLT